MPLIIAYQNSVKTQSMSGNQHIHTESCQNFSLTSDKHRHIFQYSIKKFRITSGGLKMLNIDIAQVRDYLPVLIEQTIAGNDVFITQSGLPIIRLVSVVKVKKQRQFGSAKGLIKIADDFDEPLEDFREYM
jgi:antitoxin (DNA-binding transcriptional repressor) of toxin-antitoxin stability system